MLKYKSLFQEKLNDIIIQRDVYKQQLFNESKLNIRLEKFSGYDDCVDFYTFKTDFNKLYERSTPNHLLPDLLKNNYLKEPALSMVKSLKDINQIWAQLKTAYGDVKMLLTKKLNQLSTMDSQSRMKDPESLAHTLSKLVTLLKELVALAEYHNIENHLYFSDGLHRIYSLLNDATLTRWLRIIAGDEIQPKGTWEKFIKFLTDEQKLQQQKLAVRAATKQTTKLQDAPKSSRHQPKYGQSHNSSLTAMPTCSICNNQDGENDRVATSGPAGKKIIQYHTCMKFAELSPLNRLKLLKDKGYCFQCLFPGADGSFGKHKDGRCQRDFVCPHSSHARYPVRKHVLVCEDHKDSDENKQLLEKYKQRFVSNSSLPSFSRNISLAFHINSNCRPHHCNSSKELTVDEHGIYLLQSVTINNNRVTIFYDNGCSDFLIKHSAVSMLGREAKKESSHVTHIGGVGNTTTRSTLGSYTVNIPMINGSIASLSGTCIEEITTTFPQYTLTEAHQTICQHYHDDPTDLPTPSKSVGGDVHLMIGVKYLRYHPKLIFQLPSGLAIYKSVFSNTDGSDGVIGGPHRVFTDIHKKFFNNTEMRGFCSNQYKLYQMGIQVNPDVSTLSLPSHKIKQFDKAETAGSEISYRCVNCRNCKDCKSSVHQREISIKEEMEQDLINSSIEIDINKKVITARLPFIDDPKKLAPNKNIATKIYYQQLKKLSSNPKDKEDIIASEAKLQQLGFVDYIKNLPLDQQTMLNNSPFQNFIPWRAVWKASSISTPCRIVYDASHPTASGYCLNDVLAKGQNNLNKLQEILIRWSIHKIGIHTDIRKMYNTIRLNNKDWCFQRYVWQDALDATKIPKEKIIKTLIYGVRPSGNQAEHGLREIANIFKSDYPEVQRIINEDVYVDDCVTGESSIVEAYTRADQIQLVINHGTFMLKGITFTGEDPLPNLTEDGESIVVGGMKWYPKTDEISLNITDLNFSKKRRGKKSQDASNVIPTKLTRRQCASKVAEIYDLTGRVAPLVASMKLDLQELCRRKLSWDDVIPDNLYSIWLANFNTMKDIGDLRFNRAIIPSDAVNLDIETLDFGDASQSLICTCIYARFKLKNGQHSCQLVLARTRTVPSGMTLPRAELYAALVNTHTGEIVKRSFKGLVKSSFKFTDSQITLHWISNDEKPLKQWVRSRVVETCRFTERSQWHYIQTRNMIADLGTRRGAKLKDVDKNSSWINGLPWMQQPSSNFPMQTAQELRLSDVDITEVEKERTTLVHHTSSNSPTIVDQMRQRLEFSNYLLDPNRHRFSVITRIMAFVIRFCDNLKRCVKKIPSLQPSHSSMEDGSHTANVNFSSPTDEELTEAENYFFKKGAMEVLNFLPKSKYENITRKENGILMYVGRILPQDKVSIVGRFTDAMKDLSSTTFLVPVLDKTSPVAYSIASEIHWHHPTV